MTIETSGGEGFSSDPLPGLSEDRARSERILDRLDITEDLVERADLASELVRAASRHEDVIERAVLPGLKDRLDESILERLATQRDEVREAMEYIRGRTQHLAARNAHAGDAQGLEDAIFDVTERLRALLSDEDAKVIALVHDLDPEARQELETAVEKTSKNAAEQPKPARTSLGRMASNIATKLDRVFEDVATPEHPGAETTDGDG